MQLSRRRFLAGAGGLALGALAARPAAAASTAELDAFIAEFSESKNIAGVSACAARGGEVIWQGAGGWADIRKRIAMTPDTIQNIGSVSKTVTATAVMQLVEADDVSLKADVNEYLPFPIRNPRHAREAITVRHLLTHESSIMDGPAYDASYTCGDPTTSLHDWIRSVLTIDGEHYKERRYFGSKAPGERRQYSNIGYGVLGLLVEHVTGTPFEAYCAEHIFTPLGMTNTGWRIDGIDRETHATLYGPVADDMAPLITEELAAEELAELCLYSFPNYPDGLVRTSVTQLSKFMSAYATGTILKPKTLRKMLREEVSMGDDSVQGLCWVGDTMEGHPIWYHTGGDPGIATVAAFDPEAEAVAIVFTTGTGDEWMSDLFKMLMAHARNA